jgi:phytoene synthase
MSGEMRLISRAGKTFYFATLWLEKQVRHDAALAYNFCRTVDDIADMDPEPIDRDAQLTAIASAVLAGDGKHKLVRPLTPLLARYPEMCAPLAALVDACRRDTPSLLIEDEVDLARYAFGVAGNVGLIMYPILGGTSPEGRGAAAALGIAMQCTNIARDIREDLARGRSYIPATWLQGRKLSELQTNSDSIQPVAVQAVRTLLEFAEKHYAQGISGLSYIAPQNRFAITIAARCYAAIGERVIRNNCLAPGRAVVPFPQKVMMACKIGFLSRQGSYKALART